MNLGGGVMGSKSLSGSNVTRKPGEVSDQFPAGLRVLVVDDDITCLTILEKMLRTCRYEVTKTNRAEFALTLLLEKRNGFDIVISDTHMPDMDGFKFLERVGLELDLPVIMMSAYDSKHEVMKGVTHGACDYLIKPVRIEALKNIWQHVVRKRKNEWKDFGPTGSRDEGDQQQKQDEAVPSPACDGGWKSSKRKGKDGESEEKDDSATLKKPRVDWSVELHQQFVAAVNQHGIDKAVPKKILELMNVHGLTRENVASHLQKYRLYLRRLSGVSQHQGGLNSSFMPQDSDCNTITPPGSIDLQTLAATGRLSAQALAAYTRMTPPIKTGMSMPFVDQGNLFSFENSKIRYGDGQQLSNANKQMDLLRGIPPTMELKQLVGLNQSAQTMGATNLQANASSGHQNSSLLMQMIPQQSRGQILNENVGGQVARVQSSVGQPMQSNGASSGLISRNGMGYNPVSQAASVVDFSVNQISDLLGNGFPLGSTPGSLSSMTSKGYNQEEISSDVKSTRGYAASYDMLSELQQHKSQEWQLPNPGMTFGGSSQHATSVQSNMNVAPSVLVNQHFIPNQKNEQNENTFAGKPMLSSGLENQHLGMQNANQNLNGLLADNLSRLKVSEVVSPGGNLFFEHYGVSEVVSSGADLFFERYGQEDLMSALLKQQGVASGEFDFNGYTLDNIPV